MTEEDWDEEAKRTLSAALRDVEAALGKVYRQGLLYSDDYYEATTTLYQLSKVTKQYKNP